MSRKRLALIALSVLLIVLVTVGYVQLVANALKVEFLEEGNRVYDGVIEENDADVGLTYHANDSAVPVVEYEYRFGVRGQWNITAIRNYNFRSEFKSTFENITFVGLGYWTGNPFSATNRGYKEGVVVYVSRELTEIEIAKLVGILERYLE